MRDIVQQGPLVTQRPPGAVRSMKDIMCHTRCKWEAATLRETASGRTGTMLGPCLPPLVLHLGQLRLSFVRAPGCAKFKDRGHYFHFSEDAEAGVNGGATVGGNGGAGLAAKRIVKREKRARSKERYLGNDAINRSFAEFNLNTHVLGQAILFETHLIPPSALCCLPKCVLYYWPTSWDKYVSRQI